MADQRVPMAPARRLPVLRVVGSVAAVMFGLVLVVAAATLGSCDAFGGTCPNDPPPPWDDDVFGIAATGTFLAVGVPLALLRSSGSTWRRLGIALGIGLGTALVIGLSIRSAAHG